MCFAMARPEIPHPYGVCAALRILHDPLVTQSHEKLLYLPACTYFQVAEGLDGGNSYENAP